MPRIPSGAGVFGAMQVIEVDPGEPHAANGLGVGGALVYPASFPATAVRLEDRGIAVVRVDVSELQKAAGAVTCCSLIVPAAIAPSPVLAGDSP